MTGSKQRRVSPWEISPYGWWIDGSGCKVIFDRKYRPICTITADGKFGILPPGERILYRSQGWYYSGGKSHPSNCPDVRERSLSIVRDYGLEEELRRRRRLESLGQLPRRAEGER